MANGKRVLDLGAADGSHIDVHRRDGRWLHAALAAVAAECTGVDLDAQAVAALRAEGYDVRQADAESLDLGETFDLVVAGEIIEHVANAGRFLESAGSHLAPGGRLVVTTPNAFSLHARPGMLGPLRRTGGVHPDHVAWYCAATLARALEYSGLRVLEVGYCGSPSTTAWKALARKVAYAARPTWAETLFAVAAAADEGVGANPAGGSTRPESDRGRHSNTNGVRR